MPRQPRGRIILPDGELKRFRLPESFGDEPRSGAGAAPRARFHSWFMLAAWTGFTALCAGLGEGKLADLGMFHSEIRAAVVPVSPAQRQAASQPSSPAQLARPAIRPTSVPKPQPMMQIPAAGLRSLGGGAIPVHAGGYGAPSGNGPPRSEEERAFEADFTSAMLGAPELGAPETDQLAPAEAGSMPAEQPLSLPSEPLQLSARALEPKAVPERVKRELPAPAAPAVKQTAPSPRPRIAEPVQAAGRVAHAGQGCEKAFNTARRNIDVTQRQAADVPQGAYARQLENFSAYAHCRIPDHVSLSICVAVQAGRARGVSVQTTPGDSRVASCVASAVYGFRFPHSPNPDLVRTQLSAAE